MKAWCFWLVVLACLAICTPALAIARLFASRAAAAGPARAAVS